MGNENDYEALASMTHKLCDDHCRDLRPYRCCERAYCEMAIDYAASKGVALKPTGHPDMPLMDVQNRCTAPAHLRPMCAAHHCDIQSLGCFRPREGFPMSEALAATRRYFRLRSRIERRSCAEGSAPDL